MCLYKFQSCSQYDTIGNQQLATYFRILFFSNILFFQLTLATGITTASEQEGILFNSGVALPARAARPELETGSEAPRQVVEQ